MITFAHSVGDDLIRVRPDSSLKLHFFVSSELGKKCIRDKNIRLREGILLEMGIVPSDFAHLWSCTQAHQQFILITERAMCADLVK